MKKSSTIVIFSVVYLIMILLPIDSLNVDFIYVKGSSNSLGQDNDDNDNDNNNNDGYNDASQNDENSQSSIQKSMCVSGENTLLSCNNLSSESIDSNTMGKAPDDPNVPSLLFQTEVDSSNFETSSEDEAGFYSQQSPECPTGSSITGGGYEIGDQGIEIIFNGPDASHWEIVYYKDQNEAATGTVFVICGSISS